ncbi:Ger(x)C family spore germination protein [Paenibacillus agricola]|uniref:Ger(X)C family spore germination protein n=1 Tax=Paenibacillus agricola TaxID=2716264 RepID=A0ABX0JIV8_9BACL|nr:Ger(x)C family spore germination protein [Paenibacillus agricola]NHN34947.1 Ger(x)C family spore germination protein [Paenibacillus agricola]
MKPFSLFAFSLIVFLTGCTLHTKIIDKIQIIQDLALDLQEGKIKGTVIYPRFEEKGKVKLNIYRTESDSYHDIFPRLSTKSPYPIETGKLSLVLFGKELANQGINEYIENLSREPHTASRIQLGIAMDKAGALLELSKNVNVPFHLSNKIEHNIEVGNLPRMNLHLFLERFYSLGRDPFLPYFITEEDEVKIDGLALLKEGKYVTNINMRDSLLLKMLLEGNQNGNYKIKINENNLEGFILLKNLDSKTKYTVNKIAPIPDISIDVTLKCQIQEAMPELDFTNIQGVLKAEKIINEHITQAMENLISLLKKNKVDPLRLGDRVRAKSRNWDNDQFQKVYPDLKTTVHINVDILQTGIIE